MLLQHLYLGLNKEAAHYLDITLGGSFLHLTSQGWKDVLNKILENTPYTGIHDEFPEEEAIEVEPSNSILVDPSSSPPEPIPKSLKEEEDLPLEFPFEIEDHLFEDFGNAANYPLQVKPYSKQPIDPPDETLCRKNLQELSTIMSHEWTMEAEIAENVLRIDGTPDVVHCQIGGRDTAAFYDPSVGLNMISSSFLARSLPNVHLIPTN